MKNANSTKQGKYSMQKIAERRKIKDAKIRRKINENWQRIESTNKYRRAAIFNAYKNTSNQITDEVLDGIILSLDERHAEESLSVQKRILRRIVEKRLAQAIHSKTRKNRDRKTAVAVIINTSNFMAKLHKLRFAS